MSRKWLMLVHRKAFKEYLLLTNVVASVVIDALGDYIAQRIERVTPHDWKRSGRIAVIALLLGPMEHYWYKYLDWKHPGRSHKAVLIKTTMDELVITPFFYILFYPSLSLMEGKTWREASGELKRKLWPTMKVDLAVWPAVQLVNFYFVPPHLRVIYINLVQVAWFSFLSHMKHKEEFY